MEVGNLIDTSGFVFFLFVWVLVPAKTLGYLDKCWMSRSLACGVSDVAFFHCLLSLRQM